MGVDKSIVPSTRSKDVLVLLVVDALEQYTTRIKLLVDAAQGADVNLAPDTKKLHRIDHTLNVLHGSSDSACVRTVFEDLLQLPQSLVWSLAEVKLCQVIQ